ncbi:HTTM domain-containing protein [Fluviicola chungangensis]|uniref:HTTM domain-containing protein n=1 Tax=Fluviicola chungangensis TaxID=2597671 RepID=A0A556MRM1_9FLAO|nr:HTTM domain-containing protein [Fluviicola chungangensis]TSJ42438.1 HTTM domain-containing protein [Fluviicola chungangensis]
MGIKERWAGFLFREVSITPLIAFRIVIGSLFLFSTLRFLSNGWVKQLYIDPPFHFSYLGFDWVKPLPGYWMYLPFIVMVIASLGIILGAFYRISTSLFFLAFTYVELLDKSYYLNHYYFVSLVSFILIWLPAQAQFSLDAKRHPSIRRNTIPNWPVFLLQFQLGIVYCFAGIAKVNSDWLLEAQPLRMWLQAFRDLPLVGDLLASSWVAFVFSWFSCFYDLTIPFFLSNSKTRNLAYVFVVVFHILTWLLFPIGVFPWVMIFSTLIFFPASFHNKWLNVLKKWVRWTDNTQPGRHSTSRIVIGCISFFLIIQILIPFRYLLYPDNLFWHEEGFRFSWRVMLMEKKGYATFYVEDRISRKSIEITNSDYLSPQQIDQMSRQPDMILQFAHFLGKKYRDTTLHFGSKSVHLSRPRVTADVYVTLNGRPNQHFVSRETDLMQEEYNLKHRKWILPLEN